MAAVVVVAIVIVVAAVVVAIIVIVVAAVVVAIIVIAVTTVVITALRYAVPNSNPDFAILELGVELDSTITVAEVDLNLWP